MAKKRSPKKVAKKTTKNSVNKFDQPAITQKESIIGMSLSDQDLKGKYCNLAVIKHTEREFVFDFFLSIDNHNFLSSRVITNPKHAKEICDVLANNLKGYEARYGQILPKTEKKAERKK